MSLINGKFRKWAVSVFLLCLVCFSGTFALRASAAVNVVATAQKAESGKWKTDAKGKRYRLDKNGKYIKNAWRKISGSVYRFNAKGYVETGWFVYKGNQYYAKASGKLCVNKWIKKKGLYYYLRADGILAKKAVVKSGGKYYYVDQSGVRVTNSWITLKGKKYYFAWNGVRIQNKWVMDNGNFYYLGSSGAMAVNQWVDGGNYYVGADGARMVNCVVDGFQLDESGKKIVQKSSGKYIFVGDSRTEGIRLSVSAKDTKYIAKVSMGYAWLKSTAGPELKALLKENPDVTVVLAFGINDLDNISNYISYYKTLFTQYPKTSFFVMAVNPVNEKVGAAHGYKVKNSQIKKFNKQMKAAVGSGRYLNTYTYLKKKGFSTPDGVHYTSDVYKDLYDYVIQNTKK